jgi:3'(2'), 5'-bisphosphate nucleotidase
MNIESKKEDLLKLVAESCKIALQIYKAGFKVLTKNDGTPVTEADKQISAFMIKELGKLTPDVPVISEETDDFHEYETRKDFENVWILDPIDGTKGFVNKTDDYVVCLGLSNNGSPVVGFIGHPATRTVYYTLKQGKVLKRVYDSNFLGFYEIGLFKNNVKKYPNNVVRIVGSSNLNEATEEFLKKYPKYTYSGMHSALKYCLLLEGKADLFVRFRASYEWDNCAGHAIVKSFGGRVVNPHTNESLKYNKENLICPDFIVCV